MARRKEPVFEERQITVENQLNGTSVDLTVQVVKQEGNRDRNNDPHEGHFRLTPEQIEYARKTLHPAGGQCKNAGLLNERYTDGRYWGYAGIFFNHGPGDLQSYIGFFDNPDAYREDPEHEVVSTEHIVDGKVVDREKPLIFTVEQVWDDRPGVTLRRKEDGFEYLHHRVDVPVRTDIPTLGTEGPNRNLVRMYGRHIGTMLPAVGEFPEGFHTNPPYALMAEKGKGKRKKTVECCFIPGDWETVKAVLEEDANRMIHNGMEHIDRVQREYGVTDDTDCSEALKAQS